MQRESVQLGSTTVEVLTEGAVFLGIGAISTNGVQVRSGRLPLRPYSQSFSGVELKRLELAGIERNPDSIVVRTTAVFGSMPIKLMRDHSFDPIHETADWDEPTKSGRASLNIVFKNASDEFGGTFFNGFTYAYEFNSPDVPLFYLLDMASWELDGDIAGAYIVSQSSCSTPTVHVEPDTYWTTEGLIHWEEENSKSNKVMTHNLPRWASHQAFDFQCKGDTTLLGVFEHVDLIRTLLVRDPGKAELRTFDKHIFDQTTSYKTSPKKILVSTEPKTEVAQRNLWTRVIDAVHDRARAEFELAEEPMVPRIHCNYWDNFTFQDYYRDLLPAASALGFEAVFIDNVNKSSMTERTPSESFHWNMCCGHEYEVAQRLGGPEKLKRLVEDFKKHGVRVQSWTNNDQSLASPVNAAERDERGWFVKMEDTRLKYGGAYTNCMSILNFKVDAPRQYWADCMKKNLETTGLDEYLFDSFYNLGFMPVSYGNLNPTTQWRELLKSFKELQDAGVHFLIESFGPFGSPQHGCPATYGLPENHFTCYKLAVGLGYTTIPSGTDVEIKSEADFIYRCFAHMVSPGFSLMQNNVRIDDLWTPEHKAALADYRNNRQHMKVRYLQESDSAVVWHNADGNRATIWSLATQKVALPGKVQDVTTGEQLPESLTYTLRSGHTYAVSGATLPTQLEIVK